MGSKRIQHEGTTTPNEKFLIQRRSGGDKAEHPLGPYLACRPCPPAHSPPTPSAPATPVLSCQGSRLHGCCPLQPPTCLSPPRGMGNLRPALTPALPGLPGQLVEASRTTSPHTAPLGERVGERGWPDPPPCLGAASVSPTRA